MTISPYRHKQIIAMKQIRYFIIIKYFVFMITDSSHNEKYSLHIFAVGISLSKRQRVHSNGATGYPFGNANAIAIQQCVYDGGSFEVKDCAKESPWCTTEESKEWTKRDREGRRRRRGRGGGEGGREVRTRRRGTRILRDYRARHQRITASEDKIYM